jgi:NAD(P)-dependent dehydrogenase (short-subunit alcohol dehydrogenase family)
MRVRVAAKSTLTATAESLERDLRADTVIDLYTTYCQTKFVQLANAHWWRRELAGKATVVAVSPGFIPGTNLVKKSGLFSEDMPGAQSIAEGRRFESCVLRK